MAIRDESTGTAEHLKDSRFHGASLLSDPETHEMAPLMKPLEAKLRKARDTREDREGDQVEAFAILIRCDWVIDNAHKFVELEVFAACNRKRTDERYRAVYPKGLAALIALRGEDEKRATDTMLHALEAHFPAIHKKHAKELVAFAAAAEKAETEWTNASDAADAALLAEFAARRALIRQLQKNEGALLTLFPGDKTRVRSYFRPVKRGAAANDGSGEASADGPEETPASPSGEK